MSSLDPAPLSRSVKLAGSELTCSCHACAFFSSDDEEQAVLAPFAKDGLAANDRLVQIINDQHREDRARRLKAEGIDVDAATASGQLDMRPWEEAYLSGGSGFDQDAMLALIQEVLKEGRSSGFGMTRLWANMEWALEDLPGVDQIVEYETRLNHVLPEVRRRGRVHLRPQQVQRRHGHGHTPHPSAGDRRRGAPAKSLLRSARPVPGRAAGSKEVRLADFRPGGVTVERGGSGRRR